MPNPVRSGTALAPDSTLSYLTLQAAFASDLREVDQAIQHHLRSQVELLNLVVEHIVCNAGKRLRPLMTLIAARACGYPGRDHFTLAAVVELIHTATLLHDDVVDASTLRRGKTAAHCLFGNPAAVLAGDFIYSRCFQMMVKVGRLDVLDLMARATNRIAEGEILQLMQAGNLETRIAEYLEVIRSKTGTLFEVAAQLGALLAGVSAPYLQAIAGYGLHLGTAFQIVDDILDYSGDSAALGKKLGDDLAEGKLTLPLIYALEQAPAEALPLARAAVEQKDRSGLPALLSLMQKTGALQHAHRMAQQEIDSALHCLSPFHRLDPSSPFLALTQLAIGRQG